MQIDPDTYGKYATKDKKGMTILHVKFLNALYGIMRMALLYYQRFVKDITLIVFKINQYDPCVANQIIEGDMLMIVWHVDDLEISHKCVDVVSKMIEWLKQSYKKIFLMDWERWLSFKVRSMTIWG